MNTIPTAEKHTGRFDTRAAQRDRARAEYHDAFYIGTDAAGCTHWWSIYHQTIVRFDPDGDITTLKFPADKFLDEYIERVTDEHDGWVDGPKYDDGGLLEGVGGSQR